MNEVIGNITVILISANEAPDQISDNLKIVTDILTESAEVIERDIVSMEVINDVSNDDDDASD